jgi:hypothetical protein
MAGAKLRTLEGPDGRVGRHTAVYPPMRRRVPGHVRRRRFFLEGLRFRCLSRHLCTGDSRLCFTGGSMVARLRFTFAFGLPICLAGVVAAVVAETGEADPNGLVSPLTRLAMNSTGLVTVRPNHPWRAWSLGPGPHQTRYRENPQGPEGLGCHPSAEGLDVADTPRWRGAWPGGKIAAAAPRASARGRRVASQRHPRGRSRRHAGGIQAATHG